MKGVGLPAGDLFDGVGGFPDDAAEIFVLQGVAGEDGEIVAGGIMVVAVQTVGRLKGRLVAAVGAGFLRHGLAEGFHGATQMFRDGDGGVVVGFQHEGVEKIRQEKLTAGPGAQMHFGSGSRPVGKCDDVGEIAVFQRVKTGHDLCGAGHGKLRFFFFAKKNPLITAVHQNGSFGIKSRRCFRCE